MIATVACGSGRRRLFFQTIASSVRAIFAASVSLLVAVVLLAAPASASSQKGSSSSSGSGSSKGSGSGSGSQSADKQSAGSDQGGGQDKGGSSGGITGGSSPIEATMFSYQALSADARAIAGEIRGHVSGPYVLTTTDDIAVILKWRTVLAQAAQLQARLNNGVTNLNSALALPEAKGCLKLSLGGAALPFSPSDIKDLLQTVASVTAVNESLAPVTVTLSDVPLMNMVAGELKTAPVFAPSLLPPLALGSALTRQGPGLGDGPLKQALENLDQARNNALPVAGKVALQNWQVIAGKLNADLNVNCREFAGSGKAASDELNAAIAATDSFETSLFSGTTPQASVQSSKPAADKTGNAKPSDTGADNAQKNPNQKAPKAQTGPQNGHLPGQPDQGQVNVNPNMNPDNNQNDPKADANADGKTGTAAKPEQTATASSAASPGVPTLQQIMVVDLLYQALLANDQTTPLDHVHFVEVHSLEAGGGTETKSNLFTGSRLYFGGGAVTTFGVFNYQGVQECGGVAYAYQGYVKSQDVAQALDHDIKAKLNSSCH